MIWMSWMTQMTLTWMTQMTQMTGWQKASQTIDRMVYLTDKDSGLPQVYLCPRWCCSRPWSYTARRPLSTTMGLRGVWPGTARRHPKLGAGAGGPVRIRLPRCSVTLLLITTLPWPWLMFPEKQIIPTASVIFAVSYWSVATACYLGYLWRHLQSILNKCSKQVCLTLGWSSVVFALSLLKERKVMTYSDPIYSVFFSGWFDVIKHLAHLSNINVPSAKISFMYVVMLYVCMRCAVWRWLIHST